MTDTFKPRLSFVAKHMETVLARVLPAPKGPQAVVMEAARYAALGGGKRLRPFLMVETAMMICAAGSQLFTKPMMRRWLCWQGMRC